MKTIVKHDSYYSFLSEAHLSKTPEGEQEWKPALLLYLEVD